MPYIRGIRDYSFYNDEDVDHDMSVDEIQAIRLSRVPAYSPASTLAPIVDALRKLAKDAGCDDVVGRLSGDISAKEEPQQFVAEDDILLSDMSVAVEGVGVLQFPLEEEMIDKLISVSGGIKSSSSTDKSDYTNALGAHTIPSTQVRVELEEGALNNIVKITSDYLNMNYVKCSLKLSIRCLSIYGPGKLSGAQKGSKKKDNNPVRLDLVFPSNCKGGDLYIKHGTQTHKCSSPVNSDTARWTAYYSDCERRMFEVQEGHRVELTYDVQLEYLSEVPQPLGEDDVDDSLNDAVAQHFARKDEPDRILVFLLHRYSEDTLAWHKIKGRDLTYARALLAVARRQELHPFLAMGRCLETWETSGYHGPIRNGGFVKLLYWVDENGHREEGNVSINYDEMAKEVCTFRDEFWALSEPDREVKLGWYGEGPAIREQWYHRACVGLLKK